jgi:hypothetical protein
MQELFDDINALRRGIEALNKRTQEQGKPVSRAELDDALAKVQAAVRAQAQPSFTLDYEKIAQRIQGHLATPAALGETLSTGTAQLQAVVDRIPRAVAVEGEVLGFTSWKAAALVAVVPLVLVLLTQATMGLFSQVPQAKYDHLLSVAQAVGAERDYYQGQIQQFRKTMSTTKAMRQTTRQLFPPYVPSAPAEKKGQE